ncbi:MAG: Ig-like domain repeat protein [Acidobacteriaceae bacterium]|nr:Ig-like domain repeat protein [Acidobacteriaceae bacterium]
MDLSGNKPTYCAYILASAVSLLAAAGGTLHAQSPSVAVSPGIISTFAGTGTRGSTGNGGPAISAKLNYPDAVRTDAAGNVYILDTGNAQLREVTTDGNINLVAGTGTACTPSTSTCGDGGPALQAQFSSTARGLYVAADGTIYVADSGDNRIRKITTAGVISTIAGTGTAGSTGDGGAATSATLNAPRGVYVDAAGIIYIADSGNNSIRTITNGTIAKYAGATTVCSGATNTVGDGCPALSAKFALPEGMWKDAAGNLYITDTTNARVRKINLSGIMSTVAGNGTASYAGDGGAATSASMNLLQDVVPDPAGNLYIADYNNNRIRYVDGTGIISTIAGTGTAGYTGDAGYANAAEINLPHSVSLDSKGNLYILDYGDSRVRLVNTLTTQLNFGTVVALQDSTAQTVTLTSTGTSALDITGIIVPTGYKQVASGGTDCASGTTLAPLSTCQISVTFSPTLNGVQNASLLVATTAANEPSGQITVSLTGTGVYNATVASATTLRVSTQTTYAGQAVALSAVVSATGGTPTGSISFYSGVSLLGTSSIVNGAAALMTTALPTGTDNITASYNGDPTYKPSTSTVTTVTVYAGAPDFTVVPGIPAASVPAGHTDATKITVTGIYGFSGTVALSCASLPTNMSCSFAPTSVTLATNGTYVSLLAINTTSAATSINARQAGLTILASLCFGLLFFRRRPSSWLAIALLAITGATAGCSGSSMKTNANVASGTYNITVNATSGAITHSTTVVLTVE